MKKVFRKLLVLALLATSGLALAAYPDRPIEMVIPFPAGGGGDLSVRIIATALTEKLGQPVRVSNSTGAGGVIGMSKVANARADGYTLVYAAVDAFAVNPFVFKKLPYEYKDFALVGLGSRTGLLMVVSPELPINNISQFIAYAKANPGKLAWGSAGAALSSHQMLEYLKQKDGLDILHVPYSGGAAAVNDFLGKRVNVIANTAGSSAQHIKTGQMRAIGYTLPVRTPMLPDVNTFAEQGRPDVDIDVKYAVFAPAATPKDVLQRLQKELQEVLGSQAVIEALKKIDYVPFHSTVEEGEKLMREETQKKRTIVEKSGLKLE
jgi:tripartite-type tricarboxylate transporter receptor subunit TctC